MKQRQIVMRIANRLAPQLGSRGEAMRRAWVLVKSGMTEVKAVGVTFGNCQQVLRHLEGHPVEDTEYLLVREPDNAYDANAIRVDGLVWGRSVGAVGHLPKDVAVMLAPLMDNGISVRVVRFNIYGGWGRGVSLGVKLVVKLDLGKGGEPPCKSVSREKRASSFARVTPISTG